MKSHYGKCALCRKECELTFEHIPPRAAFNSTPAKPITGDKLIQQDERMPWETDGLRYVNQQQGMGKFTLCEGCNNNTGAWYGNDYNIIAHVIHDPFVNDDLDSIKGIGIRDVYPLRFLKQVLSMFCSINNFEDSRIDELRKFVLDKEKVGIDKEKYKIHMYFTESKMMKYAPLSVVMRMDEKSVESIAVSEITAYPLGFILYFEPTDSWKYDGIDITDFADCQYGCLADIEVPLCIKEMNDIFPLYYRSKEEIEICVKRNRELEVDGQE